MKNFFILILLSFSFLNVHAEGNDNKKTDNQIVLYKYKNKDGVYVYSNEKPNDSQVKYEIIKK